MRYIYTDIQSEKLTLLYTDDNDCRLMVMLKEDDKGS